MGCGKSYILKDALEVHIAEAGGMCTIRVADEKEETAGFRIIPSRDLFKEEVYSIKRNENLFARVLPERIVRDNSVFASCGIPLLREIKDCPFGLIDEIGGTEILIREFYDTFLEVIEGDTPSIGVFKSAVNAKIMEDCMGETDGYLPLRKELYRILKDHPAVELVRVEKRGDVNAIEKVKEWRLAWIT